MASPSGQVHFLPQGPNPEAALPAVNQVGKLGSRTCFQWCKDHPKTIAVVLIVIVVAAAVFALAPYLAAFALAAAFSVKVVLPSLTLVAILGGSGAAIATPFAISVAILSNRKKTKEPSNGIDKTEEKETAQKIDIKTTLKKINEINRRADIITNELSNKSSSIGCKIFQAENTLDTFPEIVDIWLRLEQAEVDEENGKTSNSDSKKKIVAELYGKIEKLEKTDQKKIAELLSNRAIYKEQFHEIKSEIKKAHLSRIKDIQQIIDDYASLPGHDPETLFKLNGVLQRLEKGANSKELAYTRAESKKKLASAQTLIGSSDQTNENR